jgi:RimJ/RimL family protein N-acetyltransferase
MHLRDVTLDDVGLYVRMRCDPAMMAELGGPLDPAEMPAKVGRDVDAVAEGTAWISMVVLDEDDASAGLGQAGAVAGSVVAWDSNHDGRPLSEVGWMVLTEFQGRGVAKRGIALLLERARATPGRWGPLHAFPGATNAASNAVCRSLGFTLLGEEETDFAGRRFAVHHWALEA